MLIQAIQSWSQSFPEEVHECHKVTCVPPSYTCAKSYTSARVPKCQQDTRVPQKKQKCHILVTRVPIHLCVFATAANTHSTYLLPQMRICYRSKYSHSLFAITNAYFLPQRHICYHKCLFGTVANTHRACLLPKMNIYYRSKYKRSIFQQK